MNEKAKNIGMANSVFVDPCGIANTSTARDILNCLAETVNYKVIMDVWKDHIYNLDIKGKEPRSIVLSSTVFETEASRALTDYYKVIGGKTGRLKAGNTYNLCVLVEVLEENVILAGALMCAQQSNKFENNRFKAMKQAIDAALKKYHNPDYDNSLDEVCASFAAVNVLQKRSELLYKKQEDVQVAPASMTKILTAMVMLDYVVDLDEEIVITNNDIEAVPPGFLWIGLGEGDIITYKEALYLMMLSSNNLTAYVLARVVGEKIYQADERITI